MNEGIDVIVVGAGLGGLCAAYALAKEGMGVLVVERGDHPGSKNVTGGRLYLEPVRDFYPELWKDAPFERAVTKERISALTEQDSVTLEFSSSALQGHSYTVLRSLFDKWLAEKVQAEGAFIIPQKRVTDLLMDGGKVKGVVVEGEEIPASVVILADGVLSPLGQRAGLRDAPRAERFAVGFKEVIRLGREEINRRFGVRDGEGVAHLFFGAVSYGIFGGGFLYTNADTVSLGIVVGIEAFRSKLPKEMPDILDEFKGRPEVAPLIEGGEMVEYSAHLIPEGSFALVKRLYGDGVLLVGDAAGFALNHGITVRGMDFAIASGFLAAEAVKEARRRGDFSSGALSVYESLLRQSFVLKDMERFKGSSEVLSSLEGIYSHYPEIASGLCRDLFSVPADGKERVWETLCRYGKKLLSLQTLKDFWKLRQI